LAAAFYCNLLLLDKGLELELEDLAFSQVQGLEPVLVLIISFENFSQLYQFIHMNLKDKILSHPSKYSTPGQPGNL
jgi:hypothetical protein